MTESTEAQERFERILRERAKTEEAAAQIAATMGDPTQEHDPETPARLLDAADTFRDTLSAVQMQSLETWTDAQMQQIATAIAYGVPFPGGLGAEGGA